MAEGLENLANMEYPGRVIMLGKDEEGNNVVVYGLSGRSPSSQARRLVKDDDEHSVSIQVTDPEQLKTGDPALLVYKAILTVNNSAGTIFVSNGNQTDIIWPGVSNISPFHSTGAELILPMALSKSYIVQTRDGRKIDLTSYEPDPISTPRINGIVGIHSVTGNPVAMFCIIKRDIDGHPLRCYYDVPLLNGHGKMIATYDGPNPPGKDPVPSFRGEPRDVMMKMPKGVDHFVESVYEAMGQFVVSVACLVDKGGYRKGYCLFNVILTSQHILSDQEAYLFQAG